MHFKMHGKKKKTHTLKSNHNHWIKQLNLLLQRLFEFHFLGFFPGQLPIYIFFSLSLKLRHPQMPRVMPKGRPYTLQT